MTTTARIIDGKRRAAQLRRDIAIGVKRLRDETGIVPKLAAILIGDDPASAIYVRRKGEQAGAVGMESETHRLCVSVSQADLLELIDRLNLDIAVHGILVQLPLPPHIDKSTVLRCIDPGKDIDGFHPVNVGLLASDSETVDGRIIPCTPMGCMMLLADELGSLEGMNAVVVGCSNIVGRPMAQLLLQARCTVSIAHIHTRDLPELIASADILVSAAGAPGLIKGSWIKPGAVVIDVGINRVANDDGEGSRIVGDVCFDEAKTRASAITPVPGGVGPMTIACLLENTLRAAIAMATQFGTGNGRQSHEGAGAATSA
ncbi:MAG: bifunctional methylenetetrahydrofolate dehydrogenase/methenyltetrahydrofolate cyclohydrolase FolD [Sphingomonadales bacterium]|nr:MAG: bifunctional methylenetetrahydrofolate dehydrogenase/methenyltetrahydrofolate cyclohydrolase FolD [Sphingomonadales bacterium]